MTGGTDTAGETTTAKHSLTVLLATALAATAFVHFTPSVLSPFLVDDFGWDRWQVGAMVTAFSLTGAAGSPAMGRYADRIGGRNALLVLYGTNTAGLILFAAAPNFETMLGVMALAGFAASAANPSTNQLISAHFAPERRAAVMGVKQAGGPIGIAIVGVLPLVAGVVGWRPAALVAAALPLAGMIAVIAIVPRRKRDPRAEHESVAELKLPLVRWLAFQGFLVGMGGGAVISFLPLYADEELGFAAAGAGLVATVLGISSVAGRVVWGLQLPRFNDLGAPLGAVTMAAVAVPLLLWSAAHTASFLLWVGVVIGGLTFMAWNVLAMLAVLEGVPHRAAGRASGDVTLGYLAGFTISLIAFGLAVDASGTYGWGWLAVALTFAASAFVTPQVRRVRSA